MGTDNPNESQNDYDNLKYQNKNLSENIGDQNKKRPFRERLYSDPQRMPKEDELLQPIRRHSNAVNNNLRNNLCSNESSNPQRNSIGFSSKNHNNLGELPTLVERNKNRKLSQQYCADFKKSYMEGNKNSFLNHLADSLNHGTTIPQEELEKFREEYIPK